MRSVMKKLLMGAALFSPVLLFSGTVFAQAMGSPGGGPLNVTVSPEPISTALFLAGGVPLAVRLYRRKMGRKTV